MDLALKYELKNLVIRRGCFSDDVDALAFLVELHLAVHEGEQSPIPTGANILAGGKLGAALAHENTARGDELAAIPLYTQPFAGAIASVTNAALTFFMCHYLMLLSL